MDLRQRSTPLEFYLNEEIDSDTELFCDSSYETEVQKPFHPSWVNDLPITLLPKYNEMRPLTKLEKLEKNIAMRKQRLESEKSILSLGLASYLLRGWSSESDVFDSDIEGDY